MRNISVTTIIAALAALVLSVSSQAETRVVIPESQMGDEGSAQVVTVTTPTPLELEAPTATPPPTTVVDKVVVKNAPPPEKKVVHHRDYSRPQNTTKVVREVKTNTVYRTDNGTRKAVQGLRQEVGSIRQGLIQERQERIAADAQIKADADNRAKADAAFQRELKAKPSATVTSVNPDVARSEDGSSALTWIIVLALLVAVGIAAYAFINKKKQTETPTKDEIADRAGNTNIDNITIDNIPIGVRFNLRAENTYRTPTGRCLGRTSVMVEGVKGKDGEMNKDFRDAVSLTSPLQRPSQPEKVIVPVLIPAPAPVSAPAPATTTPTQATDPAASITTSAPAKKQGKR